MKENEPVMLIRDKDGVLIEVGHPSSFGGAALTRHLKSGCTLETITIAAFRDKGLKLYQVN